jgi:hypothetical protein
MVLHSAFSSGTTKEVLKTNRICNQSSWCSMMRFADAGSALRVRKAVRAVMMNSPAAMKEEEMRSVGTAKRVNDGSMLRMCGWAGGFEVVVDGDYCLMDCFLLLLGILGHR